MNPTSTNAAEGPDIKEIQTAANDLIAELSERVADPDGVAQVMRDWLADYGGRELGLIAAAALQQTFAACLRRHHEPTVPPGAVAYAQPERNTP